MTGPRHTASSITDDALDALYERAELAEAGRTRMRRFRDVWAEHARRLVDRAVTAEAAVQRARALHRDAYAGTPDAGSSCSAGCGAWPCPTVTALDTTPE